MYKGGNLQIFVTQVRLRKSWLRLRSLIKEVTKVDEEETPLLHNCQGAVSHLHAGPVKAKNGHFERNYALQSKTPRVNHLCGDWTHTQERCHADSCIWNRARVVMEGLSELFPISPLPSNSEVWMTYCDSIVCVFVPPPAGLNRGWWRARFLQSRLGKHRPSRSSGAPALSRAMQKTPEGLCVLCIWFYFTWLHIHLAEGRGTAWVTHTRTRTHIQEKRLRFKLKFMHIFIEQLYKILFIVASACLICQQFWS